ncbi:MAG TPA: histidine phosphatase family protein [Terriglobia bacterium]|nr:histidine phosphatase family protein [Terriglobia bacterium]
MVDEADGSSLVDPTPSRKIDGTVYVMRHGRTSLDVQHRSDGWLDLPLSDEGQLELIGSQQALKTVPIAKIYAPDLKRTTETADLVQSGLLSSPKIVVDDNAKTWNLGVLAGTKKRYGRPEVQKLVADPTRAPLGGESYNTFVSRFLPWFTKIGKEAVKSGKPVLVVCSGSNLRLLGEHLLGDQDAIDLTEGGLAALHYSGGSWGGEVIRGHEDDSENESA